MTVIQPTEDTSSVIVSLLNSGWNTETTAKPTIALIEDVKRIDLGRNDYLLVYDSGVNKERGDVQMDSQDFDSLVHLDIRSMTSKARAIAIKAEAHRILLAVRRDPGSGWHKLDSLNTNNLTNKTVGLWRYVVDVKLVARKKVIP